MFLAYLDHGSSAKPRSLAYAIEPSSEEIAPLKGVVTVLANTLQAQAACVSQSRTGMYAVARPAIPFVESTIAGRVHACGQQWTVQLL